MSASSHYDVGDVVRLTCVFSDIAGSPVLPATVICRVTNGNGSQVATYVYGGGTLLLSNPTYSLDQPITASLGWGHWHARFEGYGPNAAEAFSFFVRDPAPFS